ncbi:MAG TPA: dihydrodipicolinate reductase [Deltaproteobacteria bacterium]|nr:dihydrodipicolinate reductase [Deltaproteobacteria bacterium]
MAYKVIVWGTGAVGKMVIDEILDNPEYDLVGVLVHDREKVGLDAGTLVGREPIGIPCSDDVGAVLSLEADAVAYFGPTAAFVKQNTENHCRALRAGKNVVSTAMSPWVYHKAPSVPADHLPPIEEACRDGGTTCFTTGIDPGFMNDIVPALMSGVCGRIDSLRIQEIIDYATYEGEAFEPMALAAPMDRRGMLEIPEVLIYAWGPTIFYLADQLGVDLDKVDTVYEKWPTPEPVESAQGLVEAGHCAAVRFEIRGWVKGRPAIVIEHVNRITAASAPDWPRAKIDDEDCYRLIIKGSPDIVQETIFRGTKGETPAVAGCRATGMRAIHAIPAVVAAPPGVVSADALPIGPGRGTMR